MSNKYASVERRIWAKGVKNLTIAPPADLAFGANSAFNSAPILFMFPQEWINKASLIRVISGGLFANFADGLVYKTPGQVLQVVITAVGLIDDAALTGGSAFGSAGVRQISDLSGSFDTELSAGNFLRLTISTDPYPETYVYQVTLVSSATQLAVNNYNVMQFSGKTLTKLQSVTGSSGASRQFEIHQLNTMHPVEFILNPLNVSSTQFSYLALILNYRCMSDLTWLTKSVSTDFDGDTCIFDFALDIEITPA